MLQDDSYKLNGRTWMPLCGSKSLHIKASGSLIQLQKIVTKVTADGNCNLSNCSKYEQEMLCKLAHLIPCLTKTPFDIISRYLNSCSTSFQMHFLKCCITYVIFTALACATQNSLSFYPTINVLKIFKSLCHIAFTASCCPVYILRQLRKSP